MAQLVVVKAQIFETEGRTRESRRLMKMPGVGPLLVSAFASVADPRIFRTFRDPAASTGLVPRQNSSGGKEPFVGISRAGDRYLHQIMVVGATALNRTRGGTARGAWLNQLLARRGTRPAAVALANKTARTAWALMTGGERYREPAVAFA